MKRSIGFYLLSVVALMNLGEYTLCQGDELTLSDGREVSGKVLAFDGQQYTFRTMDGNVANIPFEDVASFVIDTSSEVLQKLDTMHNDLAFIADMVDRLGLQWQAGKEDLSDEIHSLNPISRVKITERRGYYRDGDFVIEGKVRNGSSVPVRRLRVRAALLTNANRVVKEITIPIMLSVLPPDSVSSFRERIEKPPSFDYYVVDIIEAIGQTSEQLEGSLNR